MLSSGDPVGYWISLKHLLVGIVIVVVIAVLLIRGRARPR